MTLLAVVVVYVTAGLATAVWLGMDGEDDARGWAICVFFGLLLWWWLVPDHLYATYRAWRALRDRGLR